ncbi:hypothetical protein HDU93_006306, partial [Gonapodya sp. JEL0774]
MPESNPIKKFFRRMSEKFGGEKKSQTATATVAAVKEETPATNGESSTVPAPAVAKEEPKTVATVETTAAVTAEATPAAVEEKAAEPAEPVKGTPAPEEESTPVPVTEVETPKVEVPAAVEPAKEEATPEPEAAKVEEPAPVKKIPVSAAEFEQEYKTNPLLVNVDFAKYGLAASPELFAKAVEGLTKAGFI